MLQRGVHLVLAGLTRRLVRNSCVTQVSRDSRFNTFAFTQSVQRFTSTMASEVKYTTIEKGQENSLDYRIYFSECTLTLLIRGRHDTQTEILQFSCFVIFIVLYNMTTAKNTTYVSTFIPQCHICKDVQNCLLTIDFCTCSIKLSTAFFHDLRGFVLQCAHLHYLFLLSFLYRFKTLRLMCGSNISFVKVTTCQRIGGMLHKTLLSALNPSQCSH